VKVLIGTVAGSYYASLVAHRLIDESRWCVLTPLPGETYEFVVKDEPGARVALAGCDSVEKGTR
jgi:hypothetical protein